MSLRWLLSITPDQVLAWLLLYKYQLLFPVLVFEGPITTVIAGFLASLGTLSFAFTYVLAVVADLVGDTLYYAVGRYGIQRRVDRWAGYLWISPQQIDRLKGQFGRHAGKTLLTAKMTHGVGGLVLVSAGAAGIPYPTFLWFNALGTLPKSLALLLVGYYFGYEYHAINAYLESIALITIGVVLIASLVACIYYYCRRSERTAWPCHGRPGRHDRTSGQQEPRAGPSALRRRTAETTDRKPGAA
jgi:membrane protein DedA with SNARE-associated domain